MGATINLTNLLTKKNELLDLILKEISTWDGKIETGIELIKDNQERLEAIKLINEKLYMLDIDEREQSKSNAKISLIIEELKEMVRSMNVLKEDIINEQRILSNKDKVVDSYITNKKDSMFIDKDV